MNYFDTTFARKFGIKNVKNHPIWSHWLTHSFIAISKETYLLCQSDGTYIKIYYEGQRSHG